MNAQGERWEYQSFPTSRPAGEADVAGLHDCDHRALPAAQLRVFFAISFFQTSLRQSTKKKKKNCHRQLAFIGEHIYFWD